MNRLGRRSCFIISVAVLLLAGCCIVAPIISIGYLDRSVYSASVVEKLHVRIMTHFDE